MTGETWVFAVSRGDQQPRRRSPSLFSPSPPAASDLALALGDPVQRVGGAGAWDCRPAGSISRRVTDGESSASPSRHHAHGPQQLGRLGVLDQEAARPDAHGLDDVLVQLEGGEDETRVPPAPDRRSDQPGRLQPVARPASGCPSARRRAASRTASATASLAGAASPTTPCRARRPAAPGSRPASAPGRRPAGPGSWLLLPAGAFSLCRVAGQRIRLPGPASPVCEGQEPDRAAQGPPRVPRMPVRPLPSGAFRRRPSAVVVDRDGEAPGVGPVFRNVKHDGGPAGTGVPAPRW